jgi:hypothetical protein
MQNNNLIFSSRGYKMWLGMGEGGGGGGGGGGYDPLPNGTALASFTIDCNILGNYHKCVNFQNWLLYINRKFNHWKKYP